MDDDRKLTMSDKKILPVVEVAAAIGIHPLDPIFRQEWLAQLEGVLVGDDKPYVFANTHDNWMKLYGWGIDTDSSVMHIFMFPVGYWGCTGESPWGRCVYNHLLDPAHDTCLFCGHPEERK